MGLCVADHFRSRVLLSFFNNLRRRKHDANGLTPRPTLNQRHPSVFSTSPRRRLTCSRLSERNGSATSTRAGDRVPRTGLAPHDTAVKHVRYRHRASTRRRRSSNWLLAAGCLEKSGGSWAGVFATGRLLRAFECVGTLQSAIVVNLSWRASAAGLHQKGSEWFDAAAPPPRLLPSLVSPLIQLLPG